MNWPGSSPSTQNLMAGQTPKMHSWRCPLPHALEETTSLFFLLVRLLLRSISVATPCPLQPVIVSCLIFCPSASWASPRLSFLWQILPVANLFSLTYSHLPKIADCYLLIHGGGACSRIWGRFFGLFSPLGNRIFLGNLKENMLDWRVWFCEWSWGRSSENHSCSPVIWDSERASSEYGLDLVPSSNNCALPLPILPMSVPIFLANHLAHCHYQPWPWSCRVGPLFCLLE